MSALPASTVAQLTGLSLRQLRYLTQQGLISPAVRSRAGRGTETLYAPSDLLALIVIERVRAVCGQEVRIDRLRLVVDALRTRPSSPGQLLLLEGEGCWVHDGPLDGTLSRTGAALVLDLDALGDEANLRLRRAGVRTETLAA